MAPPVLPETQVWSDVVLSMVNLPSSRSFMFKTEPDPAEYLTFVKVQEVRVRVVFLATLRRGEVMINEDEDADETWIDVS